MASKFERLVRFKNPNGNKFYGELGLGIEASEKSLIGTRVKIFQGDLPWGEDCTITNKEEEIFEIVCPIASTATFKCFANEEYPTIFTKPPGPYEDITIHKECQVMDYEAKLCAIIGKDYKNVTTEAEALDCIIGYTAGNDLSSRYWQMPDRSGKQHGLAKSFDKFAPISPIILSPSVVHSRADGLAIKTYVNGELRQDARTNDLIFGLGNIICHISRGTTIRQGTVIMTGTPGGVGAFMKPLDGVLDWSLGSVPRLESLAVIKLGDSTAVSRSNKAWELARE